MAIIKKGYAKDFTPILDPGRIQILDKGYEAVFDVAADVIREERATRKKAKIKAAKEKIRDDLAGALQDRMDEAETNVFSQMGAEPLRPDSAGTV